MKSVLITSSILIAIIAALRPLLRGKVDPRVQYALWLVAALRLLVPGNLFTSAYSALALLDRADEPPQIVRDIGQATVPVPAMSYQDAYDQALREYHQGQPVMTDFTNLAEVELRAQELQASRPTLAELAAKCARPVWLGGAALMGLWFLLVNAGLRRKLKGAKRLDGVDCPLPVYVSGALPSPCLCGAVRPAIYVTPAALESPGRLRHVLAHELTHYRHRDHWWAVVRCACLCLYWFDPLVWRAAALSRQDCELACDEGAIRRLGETERIPYGRTLVAMIAAGRSPLLQTATTMAGGKRKVTERVKLIARRPKTVIAIAVALAIIVGCAVGCTFTGAPEKGGLSPDTLQERLLAVPEELQDKVTSYTQDDDGLLAAYYLDVSAEWVKDWSGWLLSVYGLDADQLADKAVDWGRNAELIARSDGLTYVILWPNDGRYSSEEEKLFWETYDDVRAFAEETVLATDGVEPVPQGEAAPVEPLDTLRERLNDIQNQVDGVKTSYLAEQPRETVLAAYFLDVPAEREEGYDGWLLSVCRWDQVEFEDWLYNIDTGNFQVFARDGEHYYAFFRPTDARYAGEDADYYADTSRTVRAIAEAEVLHTEGVEPFNADELRVRESLWENKTYTDVAYWPYKNITGDTEDSVWIISLVQLARDGEGGVWIPERYQIIDPEVDPTPQHVRPAEAAGMTVTEYAQQLQAEADVGSADWATDPIQVCMHFALTVYGHSEANVTADCFTQDASYIESVPERLQPTPEQKAIQTVVDAIVSAPVVNVALSVDHTGYFYQTTTPSGYWALRLNALATDFQWEDYTDQIPEEIFSEMQKGGGLNISVPNGPTLILHETANITAVSSGPDGSVTLYQAKSKVEGETIGTYFLWPGPYQILRGWFDEVELDTLRTASVPDRGQSHLDVVDEWIEGFEGAMAKCAPGSQYACTYVRAEDVKADAHAWMEAEEMDSFARSRGHSGDDYGKTWFTFSYSLVFVPENENAKNTLLAGNTDDYTGDDAPEGAQIYSRVGYMELIDGNWVCEGVGTGW